jgi:hypothetical protein
MLLTRLNRRPPREPRRPLRDLNPGCPILRYRASWCMRLCTPAGALGLCGRLAPHAMLDKTQRAIAGGAPRGEQGPERRPTG